MVHSDSLHVNLSLLGIELRFVGYSVISLVNIWLHYDCYQGVCYNVLF